MANSHEEQQGFHNIQPTSRLKLDIYNIQQHREQQNFRKSPDNKNPSREQNYEAPQRGFENLNTHPPVDVSYSQKNLMDCDDSLSESNSNPLVRRARPNIIPYTQHPYLLEQQCYIRPSIEDQSLSSSGIIFDGSPDGMPIDEFLFRLERTSQTRGIPRDALVDEIVTTLKIPALNWYWTYIRLNPAATWEQLRAALLNTFQVRRTPYDIRRLVESRRQMRKESVMEFYNQVLALTVQAPELFPDNEIMHIVRRGLKPKIQLHLAGRQFREIGDLIQNVMAIEDEWKRLGYDPDEPVPQRRFVSELNPNNTASNEVTENGSYNIPEEPINYVDSAPIYDLNDDFEPNVANISEIPDERIQNNSVPPGIPNNSNRANASNRPNMNPARNIHFANYLNNRNTNTQTSSNSRFRPEYDICWNCADLGHYFAICPEPLQRVFCFGCGSNGVRKPNCCNCNPENLWAGNRYALNATPNHFNPRAYTSTARQDAAAPSNRSRLNYHQRTNPRKATILLSLLILGNLLENHITYFCRKTLNFILIIL